MASGTYYLLCRFSPIPATSECWMEVGDEIRNVSVAYGAEGYDDEDSTGRDSGHYKGPSVNEAKLQESKMGQA